MVSKSTARPPAVLLGTGLTVLGVLRCLGRVGIPAVCISDAPDFEARSRWYAPGRVRVGAFATASDLAHALEQLPYRSGVLIPCSDHWTVEATRLPEAVRARFPACLPATDVVEALVDKARFREALGRSRVPHPLTERIRDEAHLVELLKTAPSGVFLKPVDSQRFVRAFAKKAFSASTQEEAVSGYRAAREAGIDVILQHYVPGSQDLHYFVDGFVNRDHRVAASLVRRRLRMHPPDFGNSSCTVSVARDAVGDSVEALQRLFLETGYRGIFSAEFKHDQVDGTFKLLEVNCRPWWFIEFAARCGMNVAEMAYREALGESVGADVANDYRVGRGLVHGYYDVRACRRLLRDGEIGLWQCLRSWTSSYKAIYSRDDPMPAAWKLGQRVRNWVRRRLRGPSTSRFR